MRGQRTLFTNLIEPATTPTPKATNIGRSKELVLRRDTRLLYRYYYYAKIIGKNYTECLQQLGYEFDLSESRITVCITEKVVDLKRIFAEKPTSRQLRDIYPWMTWG